RRRPAAGGSPDPRPPPRGGRPRGVRALGPAAGGARGLMREGTRGAPAARAAVMRAVHHRHDRPRVLDDPFAIRLLDAATATAVETDLARYDTLPLRRLRATIAFRSRYAEDALRDAAA